MNFPGLDPAWHAAHLAAHKMKLTPTWSLEETKAAVGRGEKILVVATTALGDSLLTLPLVETLSSHLGKGRVSMLVKAPYRKLYLDYPHAGWIFSVRGKYRWEKLREELAGDPHRIALLGNMTEPDLVPWLWWCGVRGFLRYRTRWTRYPEWMANAEMLRKPRTPEYATGHAIENNLAMAEALGLAATTHKLLLPQIKSDKYNNRVLIHPGASREIKQWPVENWARLADAVIEYFQSEVWITGDAKEKELGRKVMGAMKHGGQVKLMTGQFSLRELAQVQADSRAFLSGDTGPYHLALAVRCPTVTLFAPTDRGSSMEACGPHQAESRRHRAIETAHFSDAIHTISCEQVWQQVSDLFLSLAE